MVAAAGVEALKTHFLPSKNLPVSVPVKDPRLLSSSEKRITEAPGWFTYCLPQTSGVGHLPLPVARAAWLVDTQGCCLGLLLKVILSEQHPAGGFVAQKGL